MKKILVVDDEQMLREAYALILSTAGYSVRTAFDGQDALRQYQEDAPDLILLDMIMPNLDGAEFMQAVQTANLPRAKIIIFSNLSIAAKIDTALSLGAEKHITKSQLTPSQLLEEIKAMLA